MIRYTSGTYSIVSGLSGLIILLIALVPPAIYFIVTYRYLEGSMEAEGQICAELITGNINRNPSFWKFEETRIGWILTRTLAGGGIRPKEVYDETGKLVTGTDKVPSVNWLILRRAFPLFDAGHFAGSLVVYQSIGRVLSTSGIIAIILVLLGAGAYITIRMVPVRQIAHAEKARRESEERLREMVQSTDDAIAVQDGSGKYIFFSGPPAYAEGRTDIVGLMPADVYGESRAGMIMDRVRRVFDSGQSVSAESSIAGEDGTIWYLDQVSPMKGPDGCVNAVTTVARNITGLKKAEERLESLLEEREYLLKEVHHRVKNNLQVISGLLTLQIIYVGDEPTRKILKDSQSRIMTMAAIHETLHSKKDLSNVDFPSYVGNLTGVLMELYSSRNSKVSLELDIEDRTMKADTVLPCGLIINELVSNSLKHAFPNGRPGKVRVIFRSMEGRLLSLEISDDGIGMPADMAMAVTKSLGLRLVRVLVEQLGGTIDLGRGTGTSFKIVFREYEEAGTVLV